MCQELVQEGYHSCDGLHKKEKEISRKWQDLMDLLGNRQQVLQGFSDLMGMFREIESVTAEMREMEVLIIKGAVDKYNMYNIYFFVSCSKENFK